MRCCGWTFVITVAIESSSKSLLKCSLTAGGLTFSEATTFCFNGQGVVFELGNGVLLQAPDLLQQLFVEAFAYRSRQGRQRPTRSVPRSVVTISKRAALYTSIYVPA